MSPRIFSIEGNIGAGKTTLLEKVEELGHKNIYVLREPVDAWTIIRDSKNENILEKFYKDPKTYAFPFQILAFHTRLDAIKKAIQSGCEIILCERSLHADGQIFAKMLYHDGMIDEISYLIYQKMYVDGTEQVPLSGIIYMDAGPDICAERIVKRNRKGEENIAIEYLQRCHEYHESWLNTLDLPYKIVKYTDIDSLISFMMDK